MLCGAVTKITRQVGALKTRLQPVVPEHRFLGIHYSPTPITKLSPDYPYRSGLCAGPGLYVVSPNNHKSAHSLVRSHLLNGRHSYHVYVPECLPVETLSGALLEDRAADFSQFGAVVQFERMPYLHLGISLEEFYVPPTFIGSVLFIPRLCLQSDV
ncbi:hypothetical protein DID73_00535 [Candidatus Marinamargulisbacteria bacterium SCGC AG-343-K17]|nr:hypothetical protein DID73_00535 [Candidatus Marinamargulisbacteria bacterium SCGC AG-343-K17]